MDEYNAALRTFFDGIDEKELAAMQARREEEGQRLDFKRGSKDGEPSKDDLANLRKAVSGFANAEGGIVLWGVDSKREGDRSDRNCFARFEPIADGAKFVARLQEVTGDATSPPVSGVVHKPIPVEGGFVVKTLVPASDGGPHQDARELVYWRRHADRFRAMRDFEIRDMFGRRARPRLELWWQRAAHDPRLRVPPLTVQHAWVIGLQNVGRGIARFPALGMRVRPGFDAMGIYDLDATGASGLPRKRVAETGIQTVLFAGGGNDVIHPGQTLHVTRIGLNDGAVCCCVKFEVFAEHMETVEGAFRFYLPGGIRFDKPEDDRW